MVFTQLKPQMEQLSAKEMLKALAFLKHRLRADSTENKQDLTRRHKDLEAGRKIVYCDAIRRE